jgi:hypothetical protein
VTTTKPIDPELQAVQDAAWNIKDLCDDISWRTLSQRDKAMLASVKRDLDRLHAKIDTIQNKRKRSSEDSDSNGQLGLGAEAE